MTRIDVYPNAEVRWIQGTLRARGWTARGIAGRKSIPAGTGLQGRDDNYPVI